MDNYFSNVIMKKLLSKFLILVLVLGIFSFVGIKPAHAGASLYLSPSSTNVYGGSTFSVSVRANTGGASVNAVQANLTYPADKLDFYGIGTGGTSFEITAEGSGGSGSIKIGRGTVSAKSGDLLVATVTFKAKPSSGSATVSFAGGSTVVSSSTNKSILSGSSGGTYTFSEAPPPPKPKPKDKTAPKISSVEVKKLTRTSATITWKTNEGSTSEVAWGPTKKFGLASSSSKLVKSHSVKLDKRLLTPGATYFYKVTSKDKSKNAASSETKSFVLPGYTVHVKVIDEDGNPVVGAKVTLVSVGEASTNGEGVATFENAPAGEQAVLIENEGQTTSKVITVEEKDDAQSFEAQVKGAAQTQILAGQNNLIMLLVGLALVVAFVAAFVFRGNLLSHKKFRKNKDDKSSS
jgi:hypothetical protein